MSHSKNNVMLADSTFYLCFLEDIGQPEVLKKFLDGFDFLVTPLVYKEISHSSNFRQIQSHPKMVLLTKESLGEVLRPFFSKKQIEKGETEVIELAYQFYSNGDPKPFILDDKEPRSFILKNLPYLSNLMVGTVGFVGECYYQYAILEKDEAATLVLLISISVFRVSAEVISEVMTKIERR